MDHVTALSWRVPAADAAIIEKATLPEDGLEAVLHRVRNILNVPGLTYLATCQRVVWVVQDDREDVAQRLLAAYQSLGRILPVPERHDRFEAFAHLCEVASSLDSLVPGEPQVLGQVKAAAQRCQQAGLHTPPLEHLWQYVFRTAKLVRSQTTLFQGKVSLVPLTQQYIEDALGRSHPRAAVLGTGEIGRRCIERIRSHRPDTELHVVSRNLQRAHEFAAAQDAVGHTLEDFLADPSALDLIVCALRGEQLLSARWLKEAAKRRPVVVLDLGMPRNTERPGDTVGLRLVQMDDLIAISQHNRAQRDAALEHAQAILADEMDRVRQEYQARCHASTLYKLTQRFTQIAELRWKDAPLDRKWYDQTVRALLHEATLVLKEET